MTGHARGSVDAHGGPATECISNDGLAAMNRNMYLASKQNAWMSGQHIFRQPPPIPSNDGQIAQRRESSDRHAPSNSTSPHLANAIAPPKNPIPQSSDLLPSPAPSDDFTMEPPGAPLRRSPDTISEASRPATPATSASMDAVRKRAAARGFDHASKRHASGDMSASRPLPSQGQIQVPHQQSNQNFTGPQPALATPQTRQVQPPVRSHTNSELQHQQQTRSQPRNPTLPPPAFDPDYFTLAECVTKLKLLLEQPFTRQFTPYDHQRLSVLEDAINKRDFAYLSVHQYYCMATSCSNLLPASLRNLPEIPATLGYLTEVLGPNQTLSPSLVQWFANFPRPLAQIAVDWPTRYNQEQQMFIRFARLFGSHYLSFKGHCNQRRWPPLARELYDILAIVSTTLRKIVWRCIRRSIWSERQPQNLKMDETTWEKEAEVLFDQNQHLFLERRAWRPWNPTGTLGNEQEDGDYGNKLINLLSGQETMITRILRDHAQPRPQQAILPHPPTTPQVPSTGHPQGVNSNPPFGSLPYVAHNSGVQGAPNPNPATNNLPQARRGPGRPRLDATQELQPRRGPGLPPGRPGLDAVTHESGPGARPAQYPPPRSLQHSNQPQLGPKEMHDLMVGLLFPVPGYQPPQPIDPNPARSALHQAQLRSPVLLTNHLKDRQYSNMLYRFVKGFAVAPRILSCDPSSPDPPIQAWIFSIDKSAFARIPKDIVRETFNPASRIIDENTDTYRLRCIKWNSKEAVTQPTWFTSDSAWIPTTYFKLNGKALEPRRKLHHGKDLPIDLTPFLREGDNRLEIVTVRSNTQKAKGTTLNYALAVEIVGVRNHEDIRVRCRMNRKPAQEVLGAIKTSLSGLDTDDDISIVSSNISITLFDPISAYKIFDIPVRGRDCLHHDCFDLETFLQTRKRKQPSWPTVVDDWRCPICKADVRPPNLIIDGFMEEVRKTLEEKDLLGTRAIVVDPDGSWKPKPEKKDKDSVRDPDTPEPDQPRFKKSSSARPTPVVPDTRPRPERIVIDLDD